jgi:hypothetical protein
MTGKRRKASQKPSSGNQCSNCGSNDHYKRDCPDRGNKKVKSRSTATYNNCATAIYAAQEQSIDHHYPLSKALRLTGIQDLWLEVYEKAECERILSSSNSQQFERQALRICFNCYHYISNITGLERSFPNVTETDHYGEIAQQHSDIKFERCYALLNDELSTRREKLLQPPPHLQHLLEGEHTADAEQQHD